LTFNHLCKHKYYTSLYEKWLILIKKVIYSKVFEEQD